MHAFISDAHPNPATCNFSVKYILNSSLKAEIIISDIFGKIVKRVILSEKEEVVTISIESFIEGIYFYTLTVNNIFISKKKIVVER